MTATNLITAVVDQGQPGQRQLASMMTEVGKLVELLIATVHRIGARAERRVTNHLINAFRKVTGKENILFLIAEAALGAPDDVVREVVFPAVTGGEQTLQELVHECKTTGPVYRRTVPPTLRSAYTGTTGAG